MNHFNGYKLLTNTMLFEFELNHMYYSERKQPYKHQEKFRFTTQKHPQLHY